MSIIKIGKTALIDVQRLDRGIELNWRRKPFWILQDKKIRLLTRRLVDSAGDGAAIWRFLKACSYAFKGRLPKRHVDEGDVLDGNTQGVLEVPRLNDVPDEQVSIDESFNDEISDDLSEDEDHELAPLDVNTAGSKYSVIK